MGNMSLLLPIKNMLHKSASNAEEVREEVAQYCKSMGHISWLNKYYQIHSQHVMLLHATIGKLGAFINLTLPAKSNLYINVPCNKRNLNS
jgi:hypothetical protein